MLERIRPLVPIIVIVLGLALIGNIIRSIHTIWSRRDVVLREEQMLSRLEAEQIELKNTLSRSLTAQFIEEEARNKLGFVKEGETVLFLPEASTGASLNEKEIESSSHLGEWIELFF